MDSIYFYRNEDASIPQGGHLQGLKTAIQPNISVTRWPTEAGSKALINFRALEDATIVQRLCQGGAFLCGSTRMSEFGFGLSGSKAGEVFQTNDADAELVLDLMGESRMAALRAGVFGFKPSYGLVSHFGIIGLIPSMECIGLLSTNFNNIRKILETIAGQDELDFSLSQGKLPDFYPPKIEPQKTTIGIITEAQSSLSEKHDAIFRSFVDKLKTAGFLIKKLAFPDFSLFSLVHKIVGSVEASSCAGRFDSVRYGHREPGAKNWNEMFLLSRGAAFGPLLKSYLFQGAFFQFEQYEAYENACRIRACLLSEMNRLTSQADFLIFPATCYETPEAPALLADTYAQFALTLFANITGQPALYLPPASGAAHVGFQLAGPWFSDGRLLALGEHVLNLRQGGNK